MGSSKFTPLIILFGAYGKFHLCFYNHPVYNNFKIISLKNDQYFLSKAVLGVRIGKLFLLALYKESLLKLVATPPAFECFGKPQGMILS